MLDPGIWTDDKIMQLSDQEFIVFVGCISNADDEGIFETNSDSLFFKIARKNITADMIADALDEIADHQLIIKYGVYAFFPNWYKHQTLNRPSTTKFKRPPADEVKKLPLYIKGWENAFSYYKGKGEGKEYIELHYPFTDNSMQFTEDSLSTHGALTPNRSEMNMNMNMKRKEEKGREEKGKEKALANQSDTTPWELDSIELRTWKAFEAEYNAFIPDHTKQMDAVVKLKYLADQTGEDPEVVLPAMMAKLKELKDGDPTKKGFWKNQPFLPATLVSLWTQVRERVKNPDDQPFDWGSLDENAI